MRVLYFSRDYSPHDYRFLSSLAGNGHQVYYLRLEQSSRRLEGRPLSPKIEELQWTGGKAARGWLDYPRLAADLKRMIRAIKPDVVHAGPIQRVAFVAALTSFRPLVSMSWGSDMLKEAGLNDWMRWVTRYTLRRSAVLVGDCQAVRQRAADFGYPAERVVLFPWGVDLERFRPGGDGGLRERLGWQDAFVLLSLRAWEPLYGVDVIVKGFIQAARHLPELRLLLLGGGSQAELLHGLIRDAGLSERVYFGGQADNPGLPPFYRAADLYVSASHSDGSSVSLMEALACGKPALVSDIPGNREWVVPEKHGWLFRDGDEQALAGGIVKAAGQPELLAEMGRRARELAEERADWRKNYLCLEQAYDMAVALEKADE